MHEGNRLGVCSWSLGPGSPRELIEGVRGLGLEGFQLALDPLRRGEWALGETRELVEEAGLAIFSGMMATAGEDYSSLESIRLTGGLRPDEHWGANREAATQNASLARDLGLELVSLHAGFLPEERDSEERGVLLERLREVVDRFAQEGVRVAFETGQETASTLATFLEDLERPTAGVNFDPANMILYDQGDPLDALERLAPRVHQIHVKDAVRTRVAGTWGTEVPAGTGEVDWDAFFGLVREHGLSCDLVIEREAGADRLGDVLRARDLVRRLLAESTP